MAEVFEHAPLGAALVSVEPGPSRLLQVNRALCMLTGHSRNELEGLELAQIIHPDDVRADLEAMRYLLVGDIPSLQIEQRLLRPDHRAVWVMCHVSLVRDEAGAPLYWIRQFEDTEARRRSERELGYLADHDPLTGLSNRRGFVRELNRLLAHVRRYGSPAAILFLDLDDFKLVNDRHGHRVGDEVIVSVARAIRDRLRETDVVARLGGDEFAVLLPHADEGQARSLSLSLLGAIASAGAELLLPRGGSEVTASIGVTMLDDSAGALVGEDLLREADLAMYSAKDGGKNRVELTLPRAGEETARLSIPEFVRRALAEDGLRLYAQPVVDLHSGKADLWELLLRVPEPGEGLALPGRFLSGAERAGQSPAVDRWVLERAIGLLAGSVVEHPGAASLRGPDLSGVAVSVNLCGPTLGDEGLCAQIVQWLTAYGVEPFRLVLEVSERAILADPRRARQFVTLARHAGCHLALDDFGGSFGAHQYLRHLSFDYVKIDGQLVEHLVGSRPDQLILDSIVELCHRLGARTIGKLAGDEPTVAMLRHHGVDLAQGFYLGRPEPVGVIG